MLHRLGLLTSLSACSPAPAIHLGPKLHRGSADRQSGPSQKCWWSLSRGRQNTNEDAFLSGDSSVPAWTLGSLAAKQHRSGMQPSAQQGGPTNLAVGRAFCGGEGEAGGSPWASLPTTPTGNKGHPGPRGVAWSFDGGTRSLSGE